MANRISFIVVVRNAEDYIEKVLSCYLDQDFPNENRELIIVDGCSTDRTLVLINDLLAKNPDVDCCILNNPKKTLSSGWNLALSKARYEIILRVDAHSTFGPEFIGQNMKLIEEGYMIVGGRRETLPPNEKRGLFFVAETSRFGAGSSGFRNPGPRRFVDTIGHGAYRREVYKKVGGYDERLSRNQDIEIHIRMKNAGYKFLYDPSIWSSHVARSSAYSFWKQKYLNGFWSAIILALVDKYPFYRHFAPLALVLGVLFSLVYLSVTGFVGPILVVSGVYFSVAIGFTILEYKTSSNGQLVLLPLVFWAMHISYGIGSLIGVFSIPFFLFRHRDFVPNFPVD